MRRSPGNRFALIVMAAGIAGIAGIAGMVLGGCARPSRPAPPPSAPPAVSLGSPVDACALLTPADARELLGGEVSAPTRSVVPGSGETVSQCSYAGPTDASPRPRRYLSLLVRQSPAAPAAYDRARALAKALTGSDPVDVSGVGDKAYWTGGTFRQLTVLAKNVQLIVSVELGDGRDRVEGTKAVARKALSRL